MMRKFALCAAAFLALAAAPAAARTVDMDRATVADLNAAFAAGTLTSEKLVEMCLARIAAYDRAGPKLHAIIALNPKALETARALDSERKAKGPRSPLHGIPVVLKDNYDTADLPTTGGSVLLEGAQPTADAYVVKKLRDAGAIVLAKVNLSEFASPPARSSLGGQSLNPHDLARAPGGSSGGTGVAIAAGYAPLGMGTDTGGSIRQPASANGIVGLKPTHGLLSRAGIIPLALTFDTGGPMTRSVYDAAAMTSAMTGVDPKDAATNKSKGKAQPDYTKFLKSDSLKGARIGVARDFTGVDPDVDWAVEAAVVAMKKAGATVVDVRFPKWFLEAKGEWLGAMLAPEFNVQLSAYLAGTGPKYPHSMSELLDRAYAFNGLGADEQGPNPGRWTGFKRALAAGTLDDYRYTAVRDHALPLSRAIVDGVLAGGKLDAIVYPTAPARTPLIAASGGGGGPSPTNIANLTGFPDLIVPAGFTGEGLPVTISFFGTAFSEPTLFALGYAFEQATHAIRRPVHTPALPDTGIEIPDGKVAGGED